MRVKILIFPLVLAGAVAILIAFVWPEWKKVQTLNKEAKASQALLVEVQEKKKNIEKLKAELSRIQDKESFVLSYLPVERSDEEIINGLNYLAANSGVSLAGISVEKPAAAKTVDENTQAASSKDVIFSKSGDASIMEVSGAVLNPEIRYAKIKINVSGSYENIKNFLDQVYKMEMFNKIISFEVSSSPRQSSGQDQSADPSALSVAIEADFGRMPNVIVGKDYSAPIFGRTSFDMAGYEKLESLVARKIPDISVGDKGRSNPFSPQ